MEEKQKSPMLFKHSMNIYFAWRLSKNVTNTVGEAPIYHMGREKYTKRKKVCYT